MTLIDKLNENLPAEAVRQGFRWEQQHVDTILEYVAEKIDTDKHMELVLLLLTSLVETIAYEVSASRQR